jgi:hypothetical protein
MVIVVLLLFRPSGVPIVLFWVSLILLADQLDWLPLPYGRSARLDPHPGRARVGPARRAREACGGVLGDLEARLPGEDHDLADQVPGDLAAAAEERQHPARVGLLLAAEGDPEPDPLRPLAGLEAPGPVRRGHRDLAGGAGGLGQLLRRRSSQHTTGNLLSGVAA